MSGEERLEKAQAQMILMLWTVGVLVFLFVVPLVLLLLPYSPMTVYSYEATVKEACPGEPVAVLIDYEIQEDAAVEAVEVEPDWIAVDVPGVVDGYVSEGIGGRIPGDEIEYGERAKVRSSVLRVAPQQPGEWLVGGELVVRGRSYGIPHPQQLSPRAKEPMTILPADDPKCRPMKGE